MLMDGFGAWTGSGSSAMFKGFSQIIKGMYIYIYLYNISAIYEKYGHAILVYTTCHIHIHVIYIYTCIHIH